MRMFLIHWVHSSIPVDGVRDWRLVFRRVGDLSIEVSAGVQRVPDASPAGSVALYWVFRLVDDHIADRRN